MSDWPGVAYRPNSQVISTAGPESMIAHVALCTTGNFGTGSWPQANRASYCPVVVARACTVYQMSITTVVSAGNYDIGIYDVNAVRLVSIGTTALPAAGFTVVDITDTYLTPGIYYLGLVFSDIATATLTRCPLNSAVQSASGVREQATAIPLPATATFVAATNSFTPLINAYTVSTA